MWRRLLIAGLILVPVVLIWAILFLPNYMVGVHQRSVAQSLSDWKVEYSTITTHDDAIRTAKMLGYVQEYYVPSEGYRSSPEIETALESERQQTIEAFVDSLREFTEKDFGKDSEQWLAYLQSSTPIENSVVDESTEFSKLVDALSAEHSLDNAAIAHGKLIAGGKQAFPALLNCLDSDTASHIEFQGAVTPFAPPPIGQVCFDILRLQIEGRWPKGFRDYRVLNRTNISQWIDEHWSQSLTEMRRIAIAQVIRNVEIQSEADLHPEQAIRLLDFLNEKMLLVEEPEFVLGKSIPNPFE